MIHALVDASGKVSNLVEWDGEASLNLPGDVSLVPVEADKPISIGWIFAEGVFTDPNPPPPFPTLPPGITGNYLWTAIGDLGWLPFVQQALAASKKPLDVQYVNATGKAEIIYVTDAKWGRIMKAAAALGSAASPSVNGISLLAAVQHGQDLLAGGT